MDLPAESIVDATLRPPCLVEPILGILIQRHVHDEVPRGFFQDHVLQDVGNIPIAISRGHGEHARACEVKLTFIYTGSVVSEDELVESGESLPRVP